MSDRAKKIIGIMLLVLVASALFVGFTIAFSTRFVWWIALLITLTIYVVAVAGTTLLVLAVKLIVN